MNQFADVGDMPHAEAQLILPWLLNGTLAEQERVRAEAHLRVCSACRRDLASLEAIRRAAPQPPAFDPERALERLRPRLEQGDLPPAPRAAPAPFPGPEQRPAANDSRWLRIASAAQFGLIVLLLGLLVRPGDPAATYQALGSTSPEANAVVRFAPGTPERELRRILRAGSARVVDGPSAAGAYVLALPHDKLAPALERMRAEKTVTLAQPLDGAPAP
ncbi:zf-HC2 domain-containing protein [Massilia sp. LjRoot122]|uniref:zf-HC2 domain-containing protein n=1 Tax=Massilia sp. LjRoot122 TaxID=3342257 RepID=UPI003ED16C00